MSLMNWLRKLGILRFGAEKAVYHNARERPLSFQHADIFDSEKDVLFSGKDSNTATPPPAPGESSPEQPEPDRKGQ